MKQKWQGFAKPIRTTKIILYSIVGTLLFNLGVAGVIATTLSNANFVHILIVSNFIGLSILIANLLVPMNVYMNTPIIAVLTTLIGTIVGIAMAYFFGYKLLFYNISSSILQIIIYSLFFGFLASLLAWYLLKNSQMKDKLQSLSQKLTSANRYNIDETNSLSWINASLGNSIYLINVKDILYFEAEQKYVVAVTENKSYILSTPLKYLITKLNQNTFLQISRSVIVNLNCIAMIKKENETLRAIIKDENQTELMIGKKYYNQFKKM